MGKWENGKMGKWIITSIIILDAQIKIKKMNNVYLLCTMDGWMDDMWSE
jgi:hypothetical protein